MLGYVYVHCKFATFSSWTEEESYNRFRGALVFFPNHDEMLLFGFNFPREFLSFDFFLSFTILYVVFI